MSNKVNILHMGLGAFHRAHQAVYIQRAIDNGAPLSIGAVSQRDPKVSNCLLYTSPSPRDGLLSRMPSSA